MIFLFVCLLLTMHKKGAHRPIRCPLPGFITPYLLFYIKYCRPTEKENSLVFLNATGSAWKQASRDIKMYMQDVLDIQVNALDPSGRFVHGSRSIMLANYALRVRFDPLKLQQFATLMRHSFATMNSYYLLWTDWATARLAMSDFNQAFGLSAPEEKPCDFSAFDVHFTFTQGIMEEKEVSPQIETLSCKPAVNSRSFEEVTSSFEEVTSGSFEGVTSSCKPLVTSGSFEGVTSSCKPLVTSGSFEEVTLSCKPAETSSCKPAVQEQKSGNGCDKCGKVMTIYGPYGKRKHVKQYGCYWYECKDCELKKWIPLGYMTEYSHSRKSKNHDKIMAFIKASLK
jgi:hypothetical protein